MKKYLLVSILIASVLIANAAFAGDIITITRVENVNGSIGVYLRNEYLPKLFTDSSQRNESVTFYLDGTKTPVDPQGSIESLGAGMENLILLKAPWPTAEYQNLTAVYTDSAGASNYQKEWALVFAKPPLTIKEITTEPLQVYTNGSLSLKIKIVASGTKDVGSINAELLKQPRYFHLGDSKTPVSMKSGEEKDFLFTFKPSGESLPETVIYSTSYTPFLITYSYGGFQTKTLVNGSFIVLNRMNTASLLPKLGLKIDAATNISQGESANITIYAWNSVIDSNKLCNLSMVLTSKNSGLEIPDPSVHFDGPFKGRIDAPDEPTASFVVKTSSSTAAKTYDLALNTSYNDCDWKVPDRASRTLSLDVKKSNTTSTNQTIPENTTAVNKSNVEANKSVPEKTVKKTEQKPETSGNNTSSPKGGENTTLILLAIVGVIGVIALFGVIYFLEIKSRSIYP